MTSMSHKEKIIYNTISSSFPNTLKRELIHRESKLTSHKTMKIEIFEFIENWYNKKRTHLALQYKSVAYFNAINNLLSPDKFAEIFKIKLN